MNTPKIHKARPHNPSKWSDKHALDAREEGWDIFDIGGGKLAIQRLDEADKLASDEAALALVLGMAQNDSALHRKAIARVLGFA